MPRDNIPINKNTEKESTVSKKVWNGFYGLVEDEFSGHSKVLQFRGNSKEVNSATNKTSPRFFLFDDGQVVRKNNSDNKRAESNSKI